MKRKKTIDRIFKKNRWLVKWDTYVEKGRLGTCGGEK